MNSVAIALRRLSRFNFSAMLLVALLQRLPVCRMAATAEELVAGSPSGVVLRAAFAVAASLGALHTLAGATTQLVANVNQPARGTVGQPFEEDIIITGLGVSFAQSWKVGNTLPPGVGAQGAVLKSGALVIDPSTGTLILSGTPTASGTYYVTISGYQYTNLTGPVTTATGTIIIASAPASAPKLTGQPASVATAAGGTATLSATFSGSPAPSVQWLRNGLALAGATSAPLVMTNFAPADTGIYTVQLRNSSGSALSNPAVAGILTTAKVTGSGQVVGTGIRHPNGNYYDQVLLTGAAAAVTADAGKVTRTSFIDANDDIVQVEFAGAGTLALVLDSPTGPAPPVNYTQPAVNYMKGHVGIVIAGANETTNLLVFTVGRATAFDPTGAYNILQGAGGTNLSANNGSPLFQGHAATHYDGVADVAFVAIASTDGKFGGLRASDANFLATEGLTGVYAPGVAFQGPLYIGNIDAMSTATPVILIGSTPDARITGGDLSQANGSAVQVSGLTKLTFTAGSDSAGNLLPAAINQAVLQQNGANVTAQIVVDPGP